MGSCLFIDLTSPGRNTMGLGLFFDLVSLGKKFGSALNISPRGCSPKKIGSASALSGLPLGFFRSNHLCRAKQRRCHLGAGEVSCTQHRRGLPLVLAASIVLVTDFVTLVTDSVT